MNPMNSSSHSKSSRPHLKRPRQKNRLRLYTASAFLVSNVLVLGRADAQTYSERPLPLPAFGRTTVGNGDSTALVQNPANLAHLPGAELRWTGAFLDEDSAATSQGNAFAFAFPFGFMPLATGLRFDMINPTNAATADTFGNDYAYQWLTWGLAMGSRTASFGFSYQHSYSDSAAVHDFSSWTLGLNLRPSDYIGLGGVIRNINVPRSSRGNKLGVSYDMAIAVRPTGTEALEIGLENTYVHEQGGYWVPRGVVDVAIPQLGRIRTDVSWIDPFADANAASWIASTSLVIDANSRQGSAEASLGMRYGNALGDGNDRPYNNLHTEVAFRDFRESSAAENMAYAVRLRLESTPDTRGHTALLRKLWRLADNEPHLQAVLLELRAAPADSLAHVQELQDAIYYLQSKGKKVLCHLESASGSAMYLCSVANAVLINPAGGINYSGLVSSSFYLKGLLDKLGVRADFVRIGDHKSAPEALGRTQGSETALADRADLLQQVEMEITSTVSRGRDLKPAELRRAVASGPFTAAEAEKAGLVDGFAFDDMLEKRTSKLVGAPIVFEEGSQAPTRDPRFGPTRRLAIVYVEGDMVDGRSQNIPFLGIQTSGSYTVAESLKQARNDSSINAVVLRVETGGGSAMAADVIWREVQLTAEVKPVIVSMGNAAASGGYYISSPGTYIYANPMTITGSIGIFYGKLDIAGLLGKIGVNVETLKTTERADAQSIFRPFTDQEREVLSKKIEQFYSLFLRRVADGRKMTKEEVDKVAQGRVWTGRQAKEHKLVDALGGLRQALAKARVMGGLRDDAPIIELPVRQTSLLGKVLGVEGLKAELANQGPPLPKQMMDVARAVAPYALFSSEQPLARLEYLPDLLP